jgi:hypothetical protein
MIEFLDMITFTKWLLYQSNSQISLIIQIHCSYWSYAQIISPVSFTSQGGINEDTTMARWS